MHTRILYVLVSLFSSQFTPNVTEYKDVSNVCNIYCYCQLANSRKLWQAFNLVEQPKKGIGRI